jgi:uncharacterized protein (DUF1800 family)
MRLRIIALAVTLVALADLVGGCSAPSGRMPADGSAGSVQTSTPAALSRTSGPPVTNASASPPRVAVPGRSAGPAGDEDALIVHVLNRLGYGPRPGDLERVRAMGLEAYVERQLDPDRFGLQGAQTLLASLPTLQASIPELLRDYPRPDAATRERLARGEMVPDAARTMARPARIVSELQAARMVRAVMSERQLEEVMIAFWLNHFNVFASKGEVRWYVTSFERDAIRPHVFGKFRELLLATARHPAMLFYLDNWLSARPGFVIPVGPQKGRELGLNENYARELMELHTLGVDGGYTQDDVREVARAFTGWTIDRPQREGRFTFRVATHDPGIKVVLGHTLTGWGGEQDGLRVIELLSRHPATARFIATKLARRFVADDPPAALVERVAATYQQTEGDIRSMLRTLFASPEFLGEGARQAKIKTPSEFVASAVRALGGTVSARGGYELARATARMGEALYEAAPPTGYADRREAWVSSGALLARMNFALDLARSRLTGVVLNPEGLVAGADRRDPEAVLDRLLAAIVPAPVGAETRAVLDSQLRTPEITRLTSDDRGPADTDVTKLVALVVGSPEFQRR